MKKNYIQYTTIITVSVVAIMTLLSLVAPTSYFKQINIYSSIISDSSIRSIFGLESAPLNENMVVMDTLENSSKSDTTNIQIEEKEHVNPFLFEDYSQNKSQSKIIANMLTGGDNRLSRIAYIGDSFIEGDILTMDVREYLQSKFGGGGVGYIPIVSPVAKYRGTIIHSFSDNWKTHSILAPTSGVNYGLAAQAFSSKDGDSWVEFKGKGYRPHAAKINRVSLFFINRGGGTIEVAVNDQESKIYTPSISDSLQSIVVNQSISQIKYRFIDCQDMLLYGAYFDDASGGILLDNYSLRGSSGVEMSSVSRAFCHQFNQKIEYNTIFVQYGLNVSGYTSSQLELYGENMSKVVQHLKSCYPQAAIVMMGVSDRGELNAGQVITMQSVLTLDRVQRKVAKDCGVLFWSTHSAMQKMGGVAQFVENKWISKDYTHLNAAGGEALAEKIVFAMESCL
ncbi:MAG: hypothetical protein R3Y50_03780 [Rikenellaceae bacterium]